MASLFVIREKNTNTFCTSSKFAYFDADLQNAAMFNQRKNAEKAVSKMFAGSSKMWRVIYEDGSKQDFFQAGLKEYIEKAVKSGNASAAWIEYLKTEIREQLCEMEVVEVKLTLV